MPFEHFTEVNYLTQTAVGNKTFELSVVNEKGEQLGQIAVESTSLNQDQNSLNLTDQYRPLLNVLSFLSLHSLKMELSILVFPDSDYDEQKIRSKLKFIHKDHRKLLFDQLTRKEIEVVQHLLSGLSTKEIAEKLFVSSNTIKTHRKNIFIKTGVRKAMDLNRIYNSFLIK